MPFLDVANEQTSKDLARAETLSLPVLLVLLIVIFGGLVAAATPLLIGGLAILGAFIAVRVLNTVTDVSVFAVNVITLIGLGHGDRLRAVRGEPVPRGAGGRSRRADRDRAHHGHRRTHRAASRASPWRWPWPAC